MLIRVHLRLLGLHLRLSAQLVHQTNVWEKDAAKACLICVWVALLREAAHPIPRGGLRLVHVQDAVIVTHVDQRRMW